MNILIDDVEEHIANYLKSLGQVVRVQIVQIIGGREACVCHLEAILRIRQARISQHLIALRKAGIVKTRREGRHIFYKLENPKILELIDNLAEALQLDTTQLKELSNRIDTNCICPRCANSPDNC